MSDALAVVVGAAISGLIGVVVVGLQHRLQRRSSETAERAVRLARFTGAVWGVYDGLGPVAVATVEDKRSTKTGTGFRDRWDAFNIIYAQIQLLEDRQVYASAASVQRALVNLRRSAGQKQWDSNEWRDERRSLQSATNEFQRVSRKALGVEVIDESSIVID